MRVVKGVAVHPSTKKKVEVFLVRPPLYLTKEEKDLLDAKAVQLGFAPDPRLPPMQKARVRNSVLAELCRRTVLSVHLGVSKFPEPTRSAFDPRRPLAALNRERTVGGRFACESCQSHYGRKRVRRSKVTVAGRKHSRTAALLRQSRAREAELRKLVAALEEKLRAGASDSGASRGSLAGSIPGRSTKSRKAA